MWKSVAVRCVEVADQVCQIYCLRQEATPWMSTVFVTQNRIRSYFLCETNPAAMSSAETRARQDLTRSQETGHGAEGGVFSSGSFAQMLSIDIATDSCRKS